MRVTLVGKTEAKGEFTWTGDIEVKEGETQEDREISALVELSDLLTYYLCGNLKINMTLIDIDDGKEVKEI